MRTVLRTIPLVVLVLTIVAGIVLLLVSAVERSNNREPDGMVQGYPGRTFFRFAGTHSINRQKFREDTPFLKTVGREEGFRKLKKRHQRLLRKGLNRHERLTIRDASGKSFEVYISEADYRKLTRELGPYIQSGEAKSHSVEVSYRRIELPGETVYQALSLKSEIVDREPWYEPK